MDMRVAITAALPILLVVGCGHNPSAAPVTPAPSSSVATATTSASPSPSKAYELGRGEIGNVAFWQFNGTGTPWQKACESVVDNWRASDKAQPWWNRDDALRGCLDRPNSPTDSTSAAGSAPPAAAPTQCPPQGPNQIKIYSGNISCANANAIAARYDLQGEKYQQIDSIDRWTCYTGIADTRPLIFTCVSDQDAEFAVYPAP